MPKAVAKDSVAPNTDWSYIEKKLQQAKIKSSFIKELKRIYNHKDFTKVVELNVLLYLRKSDYHGPQVTDSAVAHVRKFMKNNKSMLDLAKKRYGVDGATVASLLWIESRHGENKGLFHVASVYLHLLQADRPVVIRYLKGQIPRYANRKATKKMQADVTRRAKTKAKWALAEIKAMRDMHRKHKGVLKGLYGSFSGAFGMPQFIPSSYVALAKPAKTGTHPDLNRAKDAIMSVANYLKVNGWKQKLSRTHQKALMRYNNSSDYASAILKLADQANPTPRNVSSRNKAAKSSRKPSSKAKLKAKTKAKSNSKSKSKKKP
ncbi:MAG: lytic murein transglycosylase [Bdellovibrionales bacterium]